MATLEQQLSDAIAAQNALTQAVSQNKAAIDASVAQAISSTRVFSADSITRARSVAHFKGIIHGDMPGVFILETSLGRNSSCMAKLDISGYDYGLGQLIDFSVAFYVFSAAYGTDGVGGTISSATAVRKGNSSKNGIWLGINPAGNICLVFGTPMAVNNFVGFVIDFTNFHAAVSTDPANWHVTTNNSPAPVSGANVGFGLVNLISL